MAPGQQRPHPIRPPGNNPHVANHSHLRGLTSQYRRPSQRKVPGNSQAKPTESHGGVCDDQVSTDASGAWSEADDRSSVVSQSGDKPLLSSGPGAQVADSTMSMTLTDEEKLHVISASYVTDVPEQVVKACAHTLKREGLPVTREDLYNRCMEAKAQQPVLNEGRPQRLRRYPTLKEYQSTLGLGQQRSGTGVAVPTLPNVQPQASVSDIEPDCEPAPTSVVPTPPPVQHPSKSPQAQANQEDEDCEDDTVDASGFPADVDNHGLEQTTTAAPVKAGIEGQTQQAANPNHMSSMSSACVEDEAPEATSASPADMRDSPSEGSGDSAASAQAPDATCDAEPQQVESQASASSSASEGAVANNDGEMKLPPLAESDPAKYLALRLHLVRSEYKVLDKLHNCGVCMNKPRDITFLPCGHVWACRSCAEPLYTCPCCQKPIIATVNTYLC